MLFRVFKGIIIFTFIFIIILPCRVIAQCTTPINTFPYQEDFEANNGGWTTGQSGAVASDWAWGHPSKTFINTAASGNKCWISGGLTADLYNSSELSWVQSPCFDFSLNQNPYIRFKVYWETEKKFDGVVLQYSTNGGTSWTNVGNVGDPADCLNGNWYNTTGVTWLKPPLVAAGSNNGWTGSISSPAGCPSSSGSGGWVRAQHTMPYLAGVPSVVFRFVFGSGTSCNNFDGFAFDSVLIGRAPAIQANFTHTCLGPTTVQFTDLSANCPNTFAWNFGDPASGANNTSTLENPVHTFTTPGVYHISFHPTSSNNQNASTTAQQDITILGLNPSVVSPISCAGANNGSVTVTINSGTNPGPFPISWNTVPAQITQTATNLGPGTYTVTVGAVNSLVCPRDTSITIVAPNPVIPTFSPIGPLCVGAIPPALPASSTNSTPITGTWLPSVINTNAAGTTTYTFTPTAGLCAIATTLSVTVTNPNNAPVFNQVAAVCQGGLAPVLPTVSNNGITGTWSPAVSTATVGTTTYTFTPAAGQCARDTTMDITITSSTVPTFSPLAAVCQGDTPPVLPTTSLNGFTGTWSPAVSTSTTGTTIYTFTPTIGQCAATTTLSLTVNTPIVPSFSPLTSVCKGATPPVLPTTSINGITGTWSPAVSTAVAGNFVYTFTPTSGICASTTTLSLTVNAPTLPSFNTIASLCVGATPPVLPTTSLNGITGTWSPALVNTGVAGTTVYTFTPTTGQCASVTTLSVTIDAPILPSFSPIAAVCQGAPPPVLPTTSLNGITGTWSPAVSTTTPGMTVYTFTPNIGQCASITTLDITVNAPVVPSFNPIPSVCQGTTAPTLPTTSLNGINGTWSPAVSTASIGTSTYTFTPTLGQCAISTTIQITVTAPSIVPVFSAIPSICQGTAAPALPLNSNNATPITGSWNPATISSSVVGTTVYTFTPANGQCAVATGLSVTITAPSIIPTFNLPATVCQGTTAPLLPAVSNNTLPITGSWSPALVSTATIGSSTYTFTPDPGQCALNTAYTVNITAPSVVPTFNAIAPICQGTAAPALPTSSTNSTPITGSWSPAVISTNTVGTSNYVFTPSPGQCAVSVTVSVTITAPSIVPTFNNIASICQGTAAPALPSSSTNSTPITGSWSPAVISSASVGTFNFTFTPDAGQCATVTTISVTITAPSIVPIFNSIASVCKGSAAPVLPLQSLNAIPITGTWSPAVSTAVPGTTIYTFTPAAGQCATTATLSITVDDPVVPIFTGVGPFCKGDPVPVLPTTSNNGITGTWSPNVSTSSAGVTIYTFTPSSGICATSAVMNITVNEPTVPQFTPLAAVCVGAAPPVLPTTSLNGVTGTWSPTVNTSVAGTFTYTFTPTSGLCATGTTITLVVTAPTVPTFLQVGPICLGAIAPVLPTTSTNGVTGTWSPSVNTTVAGTFTYTFTPTTGSCATGTTMDIVVNAPTIPLFTNIAAVCQNDAAPVLPTISNNGITGSWSPIVSTATPGTTVYTFTPNSGQCATTTTLSITVNAPAIPLFTQINPVCQGTAVPVLPGISNNGISGTWSPSVSTSTVGSTVYTFTPTAGLCATATSMTIQVTPPVNNPAFSIPTAVCQGTPSLILPVNSNNGISGVWTPAIVPTNLSGTGNYQFIPNPAQCALPYNTTVVVNPIPADPVTSGDVRCIPGVVHLTATSADMIKWYSNASLSNIVATGSSYQPFIAASSTYYVTATSLQGCVGSPIRVSGIISNIPIPIYLGNDTVLCPNASFTLNPGNFSNYLWQDLSNNPTYTVTGAGSYYVTVTDANGCTGTAAIQVKQLLNCEDIFFSTAFSPNGDSHNDTWGPLGDIYDITDYHLNIYNRWGQVVFSSTNPAEKWDGNVKGNPISTTTNFVWIASYIFKGNTPRQQKGNLMLVK